MSNPSAAATATDLYLPGQPVVQSHPDRVAAVARLLGVPTAPVDRCRVLEIGTSAGGNLLPMAARHPESTFVGVDPSSPLLAAGRQVAAELGLANIEFRQSGLADFDRSLGTFDFILCHGLYSRVEPAAQEKLLDICHEHLAPQGVAYLSYRTYPGSSVSEIVRALVGGGSQEGDLPRRAAAARRVLQFAAGAMAKETAPYAQLLRAEVEQSLRWSERAIAFEYFESQSHPVWFHQFVERAAAHELEYVGDAELGTMFVAGLGAGLDEILPQVSDDQISLEEHMDLLRNRALHRSLLCRRGAAIDHRLSPDRLTGLYIAGNLRAEAPAADAPAGAEARFVTPLGAVISSTSPPVQAALELLAAAWPRAVRYEQLLDEVGQRLTHGGSPPLSGEQRNAIGQFVLDCLLKGLLDAHADADRFVTTVGERPRACPWARLQAEASGEVTNRRHRQVVLDSLSQNVLRMLDGKRDRADLLAAVAQAASQGKLSILVRGMPAGQHETTSQVLAEALERSLAQVAASGLLVS